MGGGSDEVKETSAEKEAAKIADEKWSLYENELQGFEDTFMNRVDNYNSDSNMASAKNTVDLQYNKAFSDAKQNAATSMAASGVNPNSGKFKKTMSNMTEQQGITQGDTVNRAQVGEQDKYIAGLKDVTAIGMGESADALSGLSNSASISQSKAISDSTNSFNQSAALAQTVGAVAGGLGSYYANNGGFSNNSAKLNNNSVGTTKDYTVQPDQYYA